MKSDNDIINDIHAFKNIEHKGSSVVSWTGIGTTTYIKERNEVAFALDQVHVGPQDLYDLAISMLALTDEGKSFGKVDLKRSACPSTS